MIELDASKRKWRKCRCNTLHVCKEHLDDEKYKETPLDLDSSFVYLEIICLFA
jgi:hypothetical protein